MQYIHTECAQSFAVFVSCLQQVGGNVALALLLTVSSNMLGIFTIPFLMPALLGSGAGAVQLSPLPLLKQLVQTILVPTLIGASLRGFVPGNCHTTAL